VLPFFESHHLFATMSTFVHGIYIYKQYLILIMCKGARGGDGDGDGEGPCNIEEDSLWR